MLKKLFGIKFIFDMRGFWADERIDGEIWKNDSAIFKATKKLENPVSLDQIKVNNKLKDIALVKQSRLSVMPLKKSEWDTIIKMSK